MQYRIGNWPKCFSEQTAYKDSNFQSEHCYHRAEGKWQHTAGCWVVGDIQLRRWLSRRGERSQTGKHEEGEEWQENTGRWEETFSTFSQSSQARSLSLVVGRTETSENSEPVWSPNMSTAAAWSAHHLWDMSTVVVQTLRLWYKTIISIKTTRYSLIGIQLGCEAMKD